MLALDHLVIAAKEPAQAAATFGEKFGMQTIEGGRHRNWGTYNYLAYFENDCYIEWLGIVDEEKAKQSDNPLIRQLVETLEKQIEGPINFALRTDHMDKFVQHFKQANISFTGPIPGNRRKPDGSQLEWRMLFPRSNMTILPFLIEWGEEKNVPSDESYINQVQLKSITIPAHTNEYKPIYGLPFHHNRQQLENGFLIMGKSKTFDYSIE